MTIIAILLKASLLMAAAVLAQLLVGKRLSATSRHLLWMFAILGLLILPALHGLLPAWTVARVTTPPAPGFARTAESIVVGLASAVTSSEPPPVAHPSDSQLASARIPWSTVAAVFYGAGVVVFLFRLVAQRWSVQKLARRATPVTDSQWIDLLEETARSFNVRPLIALRRSLEETMPMALGTRCPAILLPAVADTWSTEQRRSVLLHEIAHVARYDCLTQSLAAVACAVYWVHPGVWWTASRLRTERELACDDRVLAAGADPGDYARQLLEFAYSLRVDTAPALTVTMAAPTALEGRLRALMDSGRNRQVPARRTYAVATAVAALLVGAIATARLSEMHVEAFAPASPPVPLLQVQDPPRRSFEVASVKPNKSAGEGGSMQRRPGGNFIVSNQTLKTLILFAYQIQEQQLIGGPAWITTDRFDVVAKASGDVPPTPFGGTLPEALMLRSLLADRFRLEVHRETRQLPIYALLVARADGQPGSQLRRPATDYCAQLLKAASLPGATPPAPGNQLCGLDNISNTEVVGGSFPISMFAEFLSTATGRIVVDRTDLTGGWDFNLKWSPPNVPNPNPDRPSLFTALQEQLGLRLEATTGPVEVLVVDRLEVLIPD